MSRLPCNDSILTVWSVDGNIEYGSGKHLILLVICCGVLVIGLAYPVLVLCASSAGEVQSQVYPMCTAQMESCGEVQATVRCLWRTLQDKYRFWIGVTLMVRLTVTVTFSFASGPINAYIITTVVVGILTFWSFTNGVYKMTYLSALEILYFLNLFLLSTVSLATASLWYHQIATIVSVCLSILVSLFIMAMYLWWNFDLKKIKRRLGLKDRPEYNIIAVPQVTADEDNKADQPLLQDPHHQ